MPILRLGSTQPLSARMDGDWQPTPIRWGADADRSSALIRHCSNPACRSGWLQLFRSRKRPLFEGGWLCSPECTLARLQLAVSRELGDWVQEAKPYHHRVPLGLLMLEQGWITSSQLRRAVEAQRKEGQFRIGEWLIRQGATTEALVCRALSIQWGCPALPMGNGGLTASYQVLPRTLLEAFGALPLVDATGKFLYLGFEQCVDTALVFALERMTARKVEGGIVPSSSHRFAMQSIEAEAFPEVQVGEAASESAAAHLLTKSLERAQPVSSRLVRVHDWLWLRMLTEPGHAVPMKTASIRDVVCKGGPLR